MANPPGRRPIRTRLQRLVETYTPDGAVGRIGFSAIAGPVGIYSLVLAFGFLVNPWIGSLLVVPATAVVGVLLTITTVLTLWPVYLSVIGRVESPAEYPDERREEPEPSPMERLKTSYQRGDLTEEEFERKVEALLDESDGLARERANAGPSGARTDREAREPERER